MKPKLTKAQKRVLVARDVLKLLRLNKIQAETGVYFEAEYAIDRNDRNAQQLKEQLPKLGPCMVCAIGAAFYAQIWRFNDLRADELQDEYSAYMITGDDVRASLSRLFSVAQLASIENAFEGDYVDRYPDDRERLEFIMQNIIANQGTFKSELVPVPA